MEGKVTTKNNAQKVKILVIEDEILLAQDIIYRLSNMGYEVVDFAMTADSGLTILEKNPTIDILLIDVTIKGDKDGIEFAKIVREKYNIPFIFLTSHSDQHTMERAKAVKPYAYILKPFNDRQVEISIELALINFSKKNTTLSPITTLKPAVNENQVMQIKNSLFLKKNSCFKRVPLDEITYIQAENNYSTIYTKEEKFLYSIVMKKIEEQLPKEIFLRAHRSYIVNINAIDGFEGNMLHIQKTKIPISKSQKEAVFKLFKTI